MLLAEELVIDNPAYPSISHISIHVDSENKIIHLLDNDVPETTTLTNALDDRMLEEVHKHVSLDNVEDYRTFTYHTDGMICEYNSPGIFSYIGYKSSLVHWLFLEECKARKEGY